MAEKKAQFVGFDKAKLLEEFPALASTTRGRLASKPTVSVSAQGRIAFSTMVSAVFAGCTVAQPSFDVEGNRFRFDGFEKAPEGKENRVFELVHPKVGKDGKMHSKSVSLTGKLLLSKIGYDFKSAGDQTFDVEKFDQEKHVVIFALPKTTPAPRVKAERKKKASSEKGAVNGAASASSASSSAASKAAMGKVPTPINGADDDVIIES